MMSFIKNPNLPEGKVSSVICGTDDERIISFFNNNSISILKNEPNHFIDRAVSTHADIAAIHTGEDKILIERNQQSLKKELLKIGFTVYETHEDIKGNYPGDVKLNFALSGNAVLGNFRYADGALLDLTANKTGIQIKQGYCKCSALIVEENALITDDISIFQNASKNGFDCLLVEKGDVHLLGHGYGFIGGASGKISKNTVVFFGNIDKHRDSEYIKQFLAKYGCDFVCTDSGELRDIGGIIPLTEII